MRVVTEPIEDLADVIVNDGVNIVKENWWGEEP
jgi:hypothetical protein